MLAKRARAVIQPASTTNSVLHKNGRLAGVNERLMVSPHHLRPIDQVSATTIDGKCTDNWQCCNLK